MPIMEPSPRKARREAFEDASGPRWHNKLIPTAPKEVSRVQWGCYASPSGMRSYAGLPGVRRMESLSDSIVPAKP